MIKIPCNVSGCVLVFDSVAELREHNYDNHLEYYKTESNGNAILLKRWVGHND